jgi:hypothetical protein
MGNGLIFDPIPRTTIELFNEKRRKKEAARSRPPTASLKDTSDATGIKR